MASPDTGPANPFLDLLGRLPPELRNRIYHFASNETITVFVDGEKSYRNSPPMLSEYQDIALEFNKEFERLPTNDVTEIVTACAVEDTGCYTFPKQTSVTNTSARVIVELDQRYDLFRTRAFEVYDSPSKSSRLHGPTPLKSYARRHGSTIYHDAQGILTLLEPHRNATHLAIELTGKDRQLEGPRKPNRRMYNTNSEGRRLREELIYPLVEELESWPFLQQYSICRNEANGIYSERQPNGMWPVEFKWLNGYMTEVPGPGVFRRTGTCSEVDAAGADD